MPKRRVSLSSSKRPTVCRDLLARTWKPHPYLANQEFANKSPHVWLAYVQVFFFLNAKIKTVHFCFLPPNGTDVEMKLWSYGFCQSRDTNLFILLQVGTAFWSVLSRLHLAENRWSVLLGWLTRTGEQEAFKVSKRSFHEHVASECDGQWQYQITHVFVELKNKKN